MGRLEKVKKTVLEIREDIKRGLKESDIKKKYEEFCEGYPKLLKMIIEGGDYMNTLLRMIDAANVVERGEMSIDDMDKKVGLELAKEYIYPNIDMSKENLPQ